MNAGCKININYYYRKEDILDGSGTKNICFCYRSNIILGYQNKEFTIIEIHKQGNLKEGDLYTAPDKIHIHILV